MYCMAKDGKWVAIPEDEATVLVLGGLFCVGYRLGPCNNPSCLDAKECRNRRANCVTIEGLAVLEPIMAYS